MCAYLPRNDRDRPFNDFSEMDCKLRSEFGCISGGLKDFSVLRSRRTLTVMTPSLSTSLFRRFEFEGASP